MSHPYIHAESSAKIFGGVPADYVEIHSWYDASKAWCPDWRHRAMRHHVEGIRECMQVFGEQVINSNGKPVAVYDIGIQHQIEDVGFVPTAQDWMEHFDEESWKVFRRNKMETRINLPASMEQKTPASVKEKLK